MFSFKSYYVDDTAFILLSRRIAASKLIVSLSIFGLTIHTGSKRKGEDSNEPFTSEAWTGIIGC
jgi:hypothetical protein